MAEQPKPADAPAATGKPEQRGFGRGAEKGKDGKGGKRPERKKE